MAHSELSSYSDFTTQSDFMAQEYTFFKSFDESTSKPAILNLTPSDFCMLTNITMVDDQASGWHFF